MSALGEERTSRDFNLCHRQYTRPPQTCGALCRSRNATRWSQSAVSSLVRHWLPWSSSGRVH